MTTTLERPQRLLALDKATDHRRQRARVKRELAQIPSTAESREACAQLLLADPPPYLVTMRAIDLIAACRGTGPYRARRIVRQAGVYDGKTLGGLSLDQALRIGGQLRSGEQLDLDLRPTR